MNFSQSKNTAQTKIKAFIKKYGYYGILLIAIITVVTIILVANSTNVPPYIEPEVPVVVEPVKWGLPVANIEIIKDYSGTELQLNETLEQWEIHKAIDFKLGEGESVYAALSGKVISIDYNLLTGTVIVVEHADGFKTSYGSLAKTTNVKVGDLVSKGSKLGVASTTAGDESTMGAHLHFTMYKDGVRVDPSGYLELGNK